MILAALILEAHEPKLPQIDEIIGGDPAIGTDPPVPDTTARERALERAHENKDDSGISKTTGISGLRVVAFSGETTRGLRETDPAVEVAAKL